VFNVYSKFYPKTSIRKQNKQSVSIISEQPSYSSKMLEIRKFFISTIQSSTFKEKFTFTLNVSPTSVPSSQLCKTVFNWATSRLSFWNQREDEMVNIICNGFYWPCICIRNHCSYWLCTVYTWFSRDRCKPMIMRQISRR
jgi:hypothetical protein